MQTVETAYILAIAAGLATEACRVGAILDGELVGWDYHVAIQVGDGHLGCRDEIELVLVDEIHLTLFVGKLACAVARSLVHYIRGCISR